jgi:hypothetical protein
MSNALTKTLVTGTVGELIVQLRLLQFDVQASPPLKDTGNDLVAIRRGSFRTIQIKTSAGRTFSTAKLPKHYSILAAVHLRGDKNILHIDATDIYLFHRDEVANVTRRFDKLDQKYALTPDRIDELFGPVPVGQLGNVPNLKRFQK